MTEEKFFHCISQLQQGDMQGMKPIFDEYGRLIYTTAYQICRNQQTAEDVCSEFFLKLKKAAAVYKKGLGHKKWLIISARNLTIDYLRKLSHEIPMSMDCEEKETIISQLPDCHDTEENVTSELVINHLLSRLDSSRREIIHLKIYCELTLAEISEVLHIPLGTVAWRYRTALSTLKKLYEEVQK